MRQWSRTKLVALDFLLRRATMTLRQHLRYRPVLQDRENLLGDGNTHCCVGGDRHGGGNHERWLQRAHTTQTADGIAITTGNDVVARLLCGGLTLSRVEIADATPKEREHQQIIVETSGCAREHVRIR